MADIPGPSNLVLQATDENKENEDLEYEPEKKKAKIEITKAEIDNRLEDRLSGILCCAVCLDLPRICFQCTNGHLMCAGCFNHVLADARLKDETATCPNCRCEISKSSCTRNLAVEKAVSELPTICQFCSCALARHNLDYHERELCPERLSICKFSRIGCLWNGPNHELKDHEECCHHLHKSGGEVMEALLAMDKKEDEDLHVHTKILSLLSHEKITFNDLQLKPYRSDDFITKLFYETSRFSALNHQWVLKARINSDAKSPAHGSKRTMSYQLVVKGKVTNSIQVSFLALKGPYGDMKVNPMIYNHEFSNESPETEYKDLPITSSMECNKLLASKTISLRLIMVLQPQS